jgi:hypothetical protein
MPVALYLRVSTGEQRERQSTATVKSHAEMLPLPLPSPCIAALLHADACNAACGLFLQSTNFRRVTEQRGALNGT